MLFRTIANWSLELEKWAPHVVSIVYKGNKEARKKLEASIRRNAFNVLLTTYDYVLKEKSLLGKVFFYSDTEDQHSLHRNDR